MERVDSLRLQHSFEEEDALEGSVASLAVHSTGSSASPSTNKTGNSSTLRGISSKNPPDLISISVVKAFVHTFLQNTPESVQDQAWRLAPNEVRRLFVLAPRVMLFAHRPLCSLCHPHLSTIAWRSDICTKLSSSEANEDLVSWKVTAALAQAQHLAHLAMRSSSRSSSSKSRSGEAAVAAFHGSVVPAEASRATLQTKRFRSLVDALQADVFNFEEELRLDDEKQQQRQEQILNARSDLSSYSDENDDDDDDGAGRESNSDFDDDDDDDDAEDQVPRPVLLQKNLDSGVYFASSAVVADDGKQRRRRPKKVKNRRQNKIRDKQDHDHAMPSKMNDDDDMIDDDDDDDQQHRDSANLSLADRWLFLAELHAHVRMCDDRVSVHIPVPATSPSYNALVHSILTSQLPPDSTARLEASKCVDRWRTNPQIMTMLRLMFKRLATVSADPKIAKRNASVLKRSLSMNFNNNSSSKSGNDDGAKPVPTLNVAAAMTPSDFDIEGGHLRRKLSRVFSSFSAPGSGCETSFPSSGHAGNPGPSSSSCASSIDYVTVEQAYISVSSFVLFQQRLFSTLYHATSDEQVICAALLDFIIDSDYVGQSSSSTSSAYSPLTGNTNNNNNYGNNNNGIRVGGSFSVGPGSDDEVDDDDELERRKRDQFSKKSLSSFARLSSNALSKKLADEMAVAAEQRERERILTSARKRTDIFEMKARMKDKVMGVAKHFTATTSQLLSGQGRRRNPVTCEHSGRTKISNVDDVHNSNGKIEGNGSIFNLTSTCSASAVASSSAVPQQSEGIHNNKTVNVMSHFDSFYQDDLLLKAQQTVRNYQSGPGGSRSSAARTASDATGGAAAITSFSSTAAVSGISNGAKGLLQVRDFARFGVFFEGFCKFMFELCDNWAASHSIDAVSAFLGFLCQVSFPHPIDTIWARNLPQHLKNELKLNQHQKEQQQKEQQLQNQLQDAGLDTAFDILEQHVADEAAAAEDAEGGGGGKKKNLGSDVLSSLIEASKRKARRSQISRNKAKDAQKKKNKEAADDAVRGLPQIVVHAPDLNNSGPSPTATSNSLHHSKDSSKKKKPDKKKVTFRIEIVDDYASEDDEDDDRDQKEIAEAERKRKQALAEAEAKAQANVTPASKVLKPSRRYANRKYSNGVDDDHDEEAEDDESVQEKQDSDSNVVEPDLLHASTPFPSTDSSDIIETVVPKDDSDDVGSNHNIRRRRNSTDDVDMFDEDSGDLLTPGMNGSTSRDGRFDDSLVNLPSVDEFPQDTNNGNGSSIRRRKFGSGYDGLLYTNPERLLSFSMAGNGSVTSLNLREPSASSSTSRIQTPVQQQQQPQQQQQQQQPQHHHHLERGWSGVSSSSCDDLSTSELVPAPLLERLLDEQRRRRRRSSEGDSSFRGQTTDGGDVVGDNDRQQVASTASGEGTVASQIESLLFGKTGMARRLSHRNQVEFLMEVMRRKRDKVMESNKTILQHQESMKKKLEQRRKDEEDLERLLLALRNARDPVLERYSHLLAALPPTDKDGTPLKRSLAGRTVKPFEERRFLYDLLLDEMERKRMVQNELAGADNSAKPHCSRPVTSSSSSPPSFPSSFGIDYFYPRSSRQSSRKLLPIVETTFEVDSKELEVEKARQVLIKSMIVGGVSQKLNPHRPNTSASTASSGGRFVRSRPATTGSFSNNNSNKQKQSEDGTLVEHEKSKQKPMLEIVY